MSLALSSLAAFAARPPVAQQITWFYAASLSKGASFLTSLGFDEVNNTKQQSLCRIFHAAPSHFIGVCDSRPAPTCPNGPEGATAPPVTYTLVVPTIADVDAWHTHLMVDVGSTRAMATTPSHSSKFGCYAFNFYDRDRMHGLGCYRFEVQSFEDPAWPPPQCPPIHGVDEQLVRTTAVANASPTSAAVATAVSVASPTAAPRLVILDLFVASMCPDAPLCERMLEPVLEAVGALVDVRLGFIGELDAAGSSGGSSGSGSGGSSGGLSCLHGPAECVGNRAQLCTQRHWPYHVSVETHRLPAHLNWMLFLRCVAESHDGGGSGLFNHTNTSRIPENTHSCLQRYAVPSATADAIDECVRGPEGAALLAASMERTHRMCGHHSSAPGVACKSCSMFVDSLPVCVLDAGAVYNCSGLGSDSQRWIAKICSAASTAGWADNSLPLACRVPSVAVGSSGWPRVHGHSYASTDPGASADFAVKYLGATLLSDHSPKCTANAGAGAAQLPPHAGTLDSSPREVTVRLPLHHDYRGGGLTLRFVRNPHKPGGKYDIAAHVAAMHVLYGNLSVNTGHHWNQFFDSHLGFYPPNSQELARSLLRDRVPFFTGQSSGLFQSIYVVIPHTGHVVEVLGDWYLPHLPPNHIRFSSTDQFCSPKRRRQRQRRQRQLAVDDDLGVDYLPGDADTNKTTMAGADPAAAITFAVTYLGGSPIQQHRGPMADGPCTTLAWAEWPDEHQWHVVRYDTADWVTTDGLRPRVPFNISQFASYVEGLRDLTHGTYDQWLDNREVLAVGNLTVIAELLRADRVPFGVWARPAEGTCSLFVNLPSNGLAVELVSREFHGAWIRRRCSASPFDLCAGG